MGVGGCRPDLKVEVAGPELGRKTKEFGEAAELHRKRRGVLPPFLFLSTPCLLRASAPYSGPSSIQADGSFNTQVKLQWNIIT